MNSQSSLPSGQDVCESIKVGDVEKVRSQVQDMIAQGHGYELLTWTSQDSNDSDTFGHTLLHWATDAAFLDAHDCAPPAVEIVTTLLDAGLAPTLRGANQDTPLHCIARKPTATSVNIIRKLIKAGAHVDAQNEHGSTALHEASDWGVEEHVTVLLEEGASASIRNRQHRLSLELAGSHGFHSIMKRISTLPSVRPPSMIIVDGQAAPVLGPEKDKEALKKLQGFYYCFGSRETIGKKKCVASVYDMLYGDGITGTLPNVPPLNKKGFPFGCGRWFHLPANNLAWVKHLIQKVCSIENRSKTQCLGVQDMIDEIFHKKGTRVRYRMADVTEASRSLGHRGAKFTVKSIVVPFIDVDMIQKQDPHVSPGELAEAGQLPGKTAVQKAMWTALRDYGYEMFPPRTLDQLQYENLSARTPIARDSEQVYRQVHRFAPRARLQGAQLEDPIITVPQLWIWQIGDDTLVTALQDRWAKEEIGTASPFTSIAPGKELGAQAMESLIRRILESTIGFVDRTVPTQEGSISCSDAFSGFLAYINHRTAINYESFGADLGLSPKQIFGNVRAEVRLLHELSHLQDEAKTIMAVMQDQLRVANKVLGEFEHRPLMHFEHINHEAKTLRQSLLDLLDLRQQEVSIHNLTTNKRTADLVLLFTVLTCIFAPFGFALRILNTDISGDGLAQHTPGKVVWVLIVSIICTLLLLLLIAGLIAVSKHIAGNITRVMRQRSNDYNDQLEREGQPGSADEYGNMGKTSGGSLGMSSFGGSDKRFSGRTASDRPTTSATAISSGTAGGWSSRFSMLSRLGMAKSRRRSSAQTDEESAVPIQAPGQDERAPKFN